MKIAITGSSGLVGTAVSGRLDADGHEVTRMVRSREAARASDAIFWDPSRGEIDSSGLAGHDAVVNLAGENIFGLWTEAKKRRIRESRVAGTRLIAETLAGLDDTVRPKVLINASAIGYYGDRPSDEAMAEDASAGDRFMSRVVRDWEAATAPAAASGVRVAMLRSGLVLDPAGLLLQGMTASTWLGLGAKLGDGRQVFPWVTRDELANLVPFVLARTDLSGPINAVAPDKVTNEEFADTVARVMSRPRWLTIPGFVLQLVGDLGDELQTGAWVVPEKLTAAGYPWRDPRLEPALRRLL
jgi:uncharacterized protein (TIGR01777 family)